MSYTELVKTVSDIVDNSTSLPFLEVLFRWYIIIPISIGISLFIKVAIAKAVSYEFSQSSDRFDFFDTYEEEMCIIAFFCCFIGAIILGGTFAFNDSYDTKAVDKVYKEYMLKQEDVTFKASEFVVYEDGYDVPASYDKWYNVFTFDVDNCENCIYKAVAFKYEDEEYYVSDILVSYSLEDDAKPYLKTKRFLADDLAHIEKDTLFNPILYVPKSEGGFK